MDAFNKRDAQALASRWTAVGEYENTQGVNLRGREALAAAFAEFFAASPDVVAQVSASSTRTVAQGAAIQEGDVTVRRGPVEPVTRARFTAIYVNEGGQWLLASLREEPINEMSIEDLEWLIGEWKSSGGEGVEVHTIYAWDKARKFVHARFSRVEPGLELSGQQIIGVDPATGGIRSWTFTSDGGVGEADWNHDGDHWVLDAVGTLPDGRELSETNILRRVNDSAITWQSVERRLDETPLDDLAPMKVTRVKQAQ